MSNLMIASVTLMSAVSSCSRAAPARFTRMLDSGVAGVGVPTIDRVETAASRP